MVAQAEISSPQRSRALFLFTVADLKIIQKSKSFWNLEIFSFFSRKTAASWAHIYFHFTNFNTQIKSGFQEFSAFSFLLPEHTESLSDYLITVVPGIPNILDESLTW